jgi:DNA-binding NarL/FixJ family response regulator
MQIVVAGRQAAARSAISMFINARLGLEVAGETGDAEELMKLLHAKQPDLVLLDEGLPGAQLSELVSNLRDHEISPAVIVLNGQPETEAAALAAGANAFVYKGDPPKQLLIAIESIRVEREG